ncbi:LOW QUALITY PROTEIN: uncharacterized protein LOC101738607 [Bombyx mori]|uniref:Uncharacterized protein n=1 Tax=Bombyx mori TaxID=7091 RepID=A0A8R2C5X3_BOMMO|nr:LOW QUALITY PROTEIN: xanthine dehydrogenase 1 [Bombyx mori]
MSRIRFKVNAIPYSVGGEVSSDLTLADYIRQNLELRGTKYMCREAGCGACIVSVVKCPGGPVEAVNSCMVSITSCQDWEITTIEELGNRNKGYNVLQKTLADYNGTQCGYCSPAWVMAMHSLLKGNNDLTMLEIEKSLSSNVCRCTGYRPILDAFKKFAKDCPKEHRILDIEDLTICKRTGKKCDKSNCNDEDWCIIEKEEYKAEGIIEIPLHDNKYWYRVTNVDDIFKILNQKGYDSYMLVFGNTAKGAYPIFEYPKVLIDISAVAQLKICLYDQNLVVGVGLTLTELLNTFETASKEEYFKYLRKLYEHLLLVAHIPVRNIGSVGGNLMIKHMHNEFPSDVFLLFDTVGAQLELQNSRGQTKVVTMQQFLKEDMKGKIILHILLPPLTDQHRLVTFKVMPRSQSAHAIVNAAYLYKLNSNGTVIECRISYGGLSSQFTRAFATESFLVGKALFTNNTLQRALNILKNELVVTEMPPEPSAKYREKLALNLFYKGLLTLCPNNQLNSRYRSGAIKIHETRPVSEGRQIFDTNPTEWPLGQPIPKVEALIQCAGEAHFSEDIPTLPREVFAAFALSTISKGDLVKIDPSQALNVPGVIAFYSAKDIPGENSFTPAQTLFYIANEEVFCSSKVEYFNQPIGMIVAETQQIADRAAKLVKAKYANIKKPVIDIKEAKKDPKRNTLFTSMEATDRGTDVVKLIKGSNTIYGQYHFMMENLSCVTKPTEEGLEVHSATQWMDGTQVMISKALNIDCNRIDVHVRRLGGAYGMKISRPIQVAIACSLAVQKLNRPCRFIQSLTTTTRAIGKRLPCSTDFEVGVNRSGVIQHMNFYKLYEDNGYKVNETLTFLGTDMFNNCYNNSRWNYQCYDSITDTAKNTWCRSPGTLENISMAEYVVEQISYELSLDPFDVRLANLDTTRFNDLKEMSDTLKKNAEYTKRRAAVTKFNAENRWKKRGLRCSFSRWTPAGGQYLDTNMAVYHEDGTVAICHGGIEMGQGLNTKAAQICAYYLKIPLEKIQVKANSTVLTPNGFISGGSQTSLNIGVAVTRCCEELLRRLQPIRLQMNNPTWEELVKKAFDSNVDLQVHGFVSAIDAQIYNIFGVSLAEVEVDVLTGESEILRVDILQDVGKSVSPEIDIGQVEGAFIMGLGYWTCEKLVYEPNTGELLTDRTWNYSVPLARDIPQDLRVYFRKNSYSTELFLGAKATGEPPMCLSIVIAFALREAIAEARRESGIPTTEWFQIDGPYRVESLCLAAANKTDDFKLN